MEHQTASDMIEQETCASRLEDGMPRGSPIWRCYLRFNFLCVASIPQNASGRLLACKIWSSYDCWDMRVLIYENTTALNIDILLGLYLFDQ